MLCAMVGRKAQIGERGKKANEKGKNIPGEKRT